MENLKKDNQQEFDSIFLTKEDYDNEPVTYCKTCLSLSIITLGENGEFCDKCGNTQMEETEISTWEEMYKQKYGIKFSEPLKK